MSTPEAAPDACPPPLMWQDVRREFLAQSTLRQIDTLGGPASIRSLGAGPPLYLLPGFATPAELQCLLVWLLRDEFRCVTVEPDWSQQPSRTIRDRQPTMENYVERLQAVADAAGDESFSIFGSNFGAAWGLAFAQRHPERVDQLVLLQGFLHRRLSFFERQLARWCGWSRRTLSSLPLREFLQTQNHRCWFPPFDATRWQYFLDAAGAMPLRELSRRGEAVANFDLRAQAAQIQTPALVIHTEGDGGIAERCNQELERLLPCVKSEWLHNTGQLAYLTHPHRLAKLIRACCAEPALSVAP